MLPCLQNDVCHVNQGIAEAWLSVIDAPLAPIGVKQQANGQQSCVRTASVTALYLGFRAIFYISIDIDIAKLCEDSITDSTPQLQG